MNAKKIIIAILVAIFLYAAFSYFFGSDKAKIESIIEDLQKAIMAEDVGSTFADVALSYEDASGIKYLPARIIMQRFYRKTSNINLRIPDKSITVSGKKATADLQIILVGRTRGGTHYILGTLEDPATIRLGFEKGITSWKIVSTSSINPSSEFLQEGDR